MTLTFNYQWQKGLRTEAQAITFLDYLGFTVKRSTLEENKYQDIDCYLMDTSGTWRSLSIKDEWSGIKFNNIYFELANKHRDDGLWHNSGWFYTGEAEFYLIVQGKKLRMMSKNSVMYTVRNEGWQHTRTLTSERRNYQENSFHPYVDTRCGYLISNSVRQRVYTWNSRSKLDFEQI